MENMDIVKEENGFSSHVVAPQSYKNVSLLQSNDLSCYTKVITWRYWCMRVTSCPVPFLKASFPFIGGHSLIELLCALILFALFILLALPDYEHAGSWGDILVAITTLCGLRNNILNVVLGISYERALFWHKILATCTIIVVVIHMLTGTNFSGILLISAMLLMSSTYFIKKNYSEFHAFEFFYFTHLSCMILVIVGGILHGAPYTWMAGLLWIIDFVMRSSSYLQCENVKATAIELPADVIKLSFLNPVKYHAGQFVFLRIPAISKYEFHPFSISSAPHEDTTNIHIRELGDWTRRLGDFVRKHYADCGDSVEEKLNLDVMIDGPYGSQMINMKDPVYKIFVLISGGIGITPNQSIYNDLIAQVEGGRSLRKVFFVWAVKDRALVAAMTSDILRPGQTPLSFQPGMSGEPPCKYTVESVSNEGDSNIMSTEQIFENRFYLTQVRDEREFKDANIDLISQPWLKFGRPDIPALFGEIHNLVLREDSKNVPAGGKLCSRSPVARVAVCVCGPPAMVTTVQDLCRLSRQRDVIFDCHAEVFDM